MTDQPTKTRPGDQPLPVGGQECVQDALIRLIEERKQLGIQRYGSPLMTHNGRDAGRDAVEEALDLTAYSMQVAMELRDLRAERDQLRAAILDIDAHATPNGLADPDDPDGNPHHYMVTVGALHRALGKVGHTAPACTAEAALARLTAWADELDAGLRKTYHDPTAMHPVAAHVRARIAEPQGDTTT